MTKYWAATKDGGSFRSATTVADVPAPATTTDPNSLSELMRNAILLEGDALLYNPEDFVEARRV